MTAYEMRISDWSSDVCSSDLRAVLQPDHHGRHPCNAMHSPAPCSASSPCPPAAPSATNRCRRSPQPPPRRRLSRPKSRRTDRKSVVKGKSVSVRVEHGGRRNIKKKKKRAKKNEEI